jgi:hypothetical protein
MWNSPLLDGIEAGRGTQVPAPRCWNLRDLLGGGDLMVRQIEELLLLTCLGGFIAGITYAVTLLH